MDKGKIIIIIIIPVQKEETKAHGAYISARSHKERPEQNQELSLRLPGL